MCQIILISPILTGDNLAPGLVDFGTHLYFVWKIDWSHPAVCCQPELKKKKLKI